MSRVALHVCCARRAAAGSASGAGQRPHRAPYQRNAPRSMRLCSGASPLAGSRRVPSRHRLNPGDTSHRAPARPRPLMHAFWGDFEAALTTAGALQRRDIRAARAQTLEGFAFARAGSAGVRSRIAAAATGSTSRAARTPPAPGRASSRVRCSTSAGRRPMRADPRAGIPHPCAMHAKRAMTPDPLQDRLPQLMCEGDLTWPLRICYRARHLAAALQAATCAIRDARRSALTIDTPGDTSHRAQRLGERIARCQARGRPP